MYLAERGNNARERPFVKSKTSSLPAGAASSRRRGQNCLRYRLAFGKRFQFCEKRTRAAFHVTELSDFFPLAVEDNDRGKTLDAVFLRELLILFLERLGLRSPPREIEFHQDKVSACVVLKFRRGKDFLIQLHAPAAPVRTGEFQQHQLFAGLRIFLRFFVVGYPARFCACRDADKSEPDSDKERNKVFHA